MAAGQPEFTAARLQQARQIARAIDYGPWLHQLAELTAGR